MTITIYHNARCSNSRGALALIRSAGIEPVIVDYVASPPPRAAIAALIAAAGLTVREAMRGKDPLFAELGLDDPVVTDAALLDAIAAHPVLLNRPFVTSPLGTRLCRPPELVRELLPRP
jgi:arsenate reductase (glutaredoxin)